MLKKVYINQIMTIQWGKDMDLKSLLGVTVIWVLL